MDKNIEIFAEEIKRNTGIDFEILKEITDVNDIKNGGVLHKDDKAFFTIKFRNKTYSCCINNFTEKDKGIIYLISELSSREGGVKSLDSKEDFFRLALSGETSSLQTEKYSKKFQIPEKPICVMLASVNKGKVSDVYPIIEGYSEDSNDTIITIDDKESVIIKFADKITEEYQSFTEYAEYLAKIVYEESGVTLEIYVGGVVEKVSDVVVSYNQALDAQSINRELNGNGGIHSYKEFIFVKMLKDLPKSKLTDILGLISEETAKEIFEDEEMINTAEVFLEESLNISETSRKLYLHRNTLTYRLDKIERATGLNIRKFSDAVTFRLITLLSKLVG